MRNLLFEIALRLAKAGAACVIAIILFAVLVGPLGNAASPQLALLCWLSAAGFILLVETSPI